MSESGAPGVLVIAGATCAGKTALAVELAQRFDAEIVSADSRQIYRDMPIGTAAPTDAERSRVPHHLVGFLDPRERYSAARFAADAMAAIDGIHARGKRAIVVGGTGFYVRALAGDVALSAAFDEALRTRLARESRVHPPEILHAWLAARDPARAARIDSADRYRVSRALEIALAPHESVRADVRVGSDRPVSLRAASIPFLKVVVEVSQEEIDRRIEARVDAMLRDGLIDEAERVGAEAVAADAVGYPHVFAYLAGFSSLAELRALLARATRRYARRQATWFRTEPGIVRVLPDGVAAVSRARLGWL